MLSEAQALDITNDIISASRSEWQRLETVRQYVRGTYPTKAFVPTKALNQAAHREYRAIIDRSRVPVLGQVPRLLAQNLFVDGYRPARDSRNRPAWDHWQANRMDARQGGLHHDVGAYGAAYNVILPGKLSDRPVPVWRPVSPLNMVAVYADRLNDEWPLFAVEKQTSWTSDGPVTLWRLIDTEAIWTMSGNAHGPTEAVGSPAVHGTGLCPVVRYTGPVDLSGELVGEVEPLIPLQDQLDATTFNIEMAQQFAVHRQRWATGMAVPEDDQGNPVEPFKAAIDRLWVAEDPDTHFGEFAQTDIASWLNAREGTLRHICIKAQIPPGSLLLGASVTFPSAEALAATEEPHQRHTGEYKAVTGEQHEQSFRLDALQSGDMAGWEDTSAQVVWRDTGSKSLAADADALGKLAVSLEIPKRGLWEKVPGVTDQDLAQWEALRQVELRERVTAQAAAIGILPDAPAADNADAVA